MFHAKNLCRVAALIFLCSLGQFLCRRDPASVRHMEIGDGADVGSTDS